MRALVICARELTQAHAKLHWGELSTRRKLDLKSRTRTESRAGSGS